MSKTYQFPCGCEWPVLNADNLVGGIPELDFDDEKIPESCPATWELLGRGLTKGVFQLESGLGRQWTKRLRPESIDHLAALAAILRPGTLMSRDADGISMTQHYCMRKNNEEETDELHPILSQILDRTYQVLCYQEQIIAIGGAVAGFDIKLRFRLQKATAKKNQQEMAEVGKLFKEMAKELGVLSEKAIDDVWNWIKESGRYSFCLAHATCYGYLGYTTAYIKAHFPLAFFTAWLRNARHDTKPRDEIFELVSDAKLFDITVKPPDFRLLETASHIDGSGVRFGLADIKGIGEAAVAKFASGVRELEQGSGKSVADATWWEFLRDFSHALPDGALLKMVEAGAFDHSGLQRQRILAEVRAVISLTDIERQWLRENPSSHCDLVPALEALAKPSKPPGLPRPRVPKKQSDPVRIAELEREHVALERNLAALELQVTPQVPIPDDEDIEEESQTEETATIDTDVPFVTSLRLEIANNRTEFNSLTKPGPALPPPADFVPGGCSNVHRRSHVLTMISLLNNPPTPHVDSAHWVAMTEEESYGVSLTRSRVESCDLSQVNTSCKEFLNGKQGAMMLGVEIQDFRISKTKSGKTPGAEMCYLTVSDASCCLSDVVCFPSIFPDVRPLILQGNTVVIRGSRDYRDKTSSTFVVERMWQAVQSAG